MNELIYAPQAKEDLNDIFDFIADDNLSQAIEFVSLIKTEIEKLVDFPLMGTDQGKSFLVCRKVRFVVIENYLAFYRFHPDVSQIHILRVLHGAVDYESKLTDMAQNN